MTIEDLNKACNYIPPTEEEQLRYAWYTSDVTSGDLKDITTTDGKVYIARIHQLRAEWSGEKNRDFIHGMMKME